MASPIIGGQVLARLSADTLWVGCLVVGLAAAGAVLALRLGDTPPASGESPPEAGAGS
jgi:hypothetical protein